MHAYALFSGLPDAVRTNTACVGPCGKAIISGVFTQSDVSLLSWSSVDTLRCIFPSGLYLVVHQLCALHSYTPHKPQSHSGSPPRVGFCWAEANTNPASASFPSLGHSPGLLSEHTALGLDREFKEQEPPALFCLSRCCWSGGQRCCVRPTEDSVCLRAWSLHSSLPGTPEVGPMLVISHSLSLFSYSNKQWRLSQHIHSCCFLIKSCLITTFWSQ